MPRPARGSVEIVKRKDGLRTFWLRITVDGRRHRVRLGTDREGWTPARAQVELEEHSAAVQAGSWTKPDLRQPPVTRAIRRFACTRRAGLRTTCSSGGRARPKT